MGVERKCAEDLKEAPAPSRSQGASPAATGRVGLQQLRKPPGNMQEFSVVVCLEGRQAGQRGLQESSGIFNPCFKAETRGPPLHEENSGPETRSQPMARQ